MALLAKRVYIGLVFSLLANSASGAEMKPDAINSAEPSVKALSNEKATPFGIRFQVLLDRAHFSPGEIDGKFGENAKKALRAYAEFQQLPSSDTVTGEVWKKLVADDRPVLADYSLTEKDVSGPFLQKLPSRMEDMKDIPKLGFTGPREALAEKFHMSEQLLSALNPAQQFDRAGDKIIVVNTSLGETRPSNSIARATRSSSSIQASERARIPPKLTGSRSTRADKSSGCSTRRML